MHDLGFTPRKTDSPLREMRSIFRDSVHYGLGNPPVRWVMLAAVMTGGTGIYVFYALQPFLLELYGDSQAYGVAGLVASLTALAQIAGGFLAPRLRLMFGRRTTVVLGGVALTGVVLALASFVSNFYLALALIFGWGLMFAALMPVRQAYINGLIPSEQRASVLSFDSLMSSSGGIVVQPALGCIADVWSYSSSYFVAAIIQSCALPFLWLARRERAASDSMAEGEGTDNVQQQPEAASTD
jgi:MFS family permease